MLHAGWTVLSCTLYDLAIASRSNSILIITVSHHLQESFSHNAYSTNSYIGPGPRARDLRAGRKLLIVPFVKVEASSKTGKKRKAGKEAASSDKKASKRGGKSAESDAAKGCLLYTSPSPQD